MPRESKRPEESPQREPPAAQEQDILTGGVPFPPGKRFGEGFEGQAPENYMPRFPGEEPPPKPAPKPVPPPPQGEQQD